MINGRTVINRQTETERNTEIPEELSIGGRSSLNWAIIGLERKLNRAPPSATVGQILDNARKQIIIPSLHSSPFLSLSSSFIFLRSSHSVSHFHSFSQSNTSHSFKHLLLLAIKLLIFTFFIQGLNFLFRNLTLRI